ncbi:MAG: DNA-binding protein [Sphingobacteriales bacterium]|nr:MAG: DNA-binding protein [Sphingobacteriales bacterium]
MPNQRSSSEGIPLGVGYYTVSEAARLLRIPARTVNRWLGGYHYGSGADRVEMPPLWDPQLPPAEKHLELGFRDLIELRFVVAFLEAGVALQTVRKCIGYARDCVGDDRPFSTSKFRTDGRTIFLEAATDAKDEKLLDLKRGQYVIKRAIERTFKDLEIEDEAVRRWRPFKSKASIIIDPARAFGQPIASRYGVPTVALSEAVHAEGTVDRVSSLFDVPVSVVRDAVAYEQFLEAA